MTDRTLSVIRYQTTRETAEVNQRLIEEVFAQLHDERPRGLRYTALRLDDEGSFLHLVESTVEPSPLAGLGAFAAFQQRIAERVVAPPIRGDATPVGAYRLLP
jgi:hypothetical protein